MPLLFLWLLLPVPVLLLACKSSMRLPHIMLQPATTAMKLLLLPLLLPACSLLCRLASCQLLLCSCFYYVKLLDRRMQCGMPAAAAAAAAALLGCWWRAQNRVCTGVVNHRHLHSK
jgi:hypothetical protein